MRTFQALPMLLLSSTLACRGVQTAEDSQQASPARTTVEIRNNKQIDFTFYVLSATNRIRLGIVPSASSRIFTVPAHLIQGQGSLRFQADPIGSNDVLSSEDELSVREGDALQLTLH
ncbi:hypothetical protein [Stigmatella aurantiaca]|uniref:Lipoprotein n=1 Tax=Stigmatella aurantiaca (strain DW4/3-1) TaxID=378806 RepID=Q08VC7_STIAD|nr:hypothetical protein [Stigmatella aurantiaca]ADO70965.1 uncharacterized protein STAUR_3173 [Stigmatella aurantiaca DW4/3-1]EAU64427.1 hypothetical protein STIAU_4506 [Stigmatella aurantiaca DW4/3-1]